MNDRSQHKMKRTSFAVILLIALLLCWFVVYPLFESFLYWLAVPVFVVGAFGLYSAVSILKSVFTLKDFPDEEQSLHYDIGRAKQFYQDKGLALWYHRCYFNNFETILIKYQLLSVWLVLFDLNYRIKVLFLQNFIVYHELLFNLL